MQNIASDKYISQYSNTHWDFPCSVLSQRADNVLESPAFWPHSTSPWSSLLTSPPHLHPPPPSWLACWLLCSPPVPGCNCAEHTVSVTLDPWTATGWLTVTNTLEFSVSLPLWTASVFPLLPDFVQRSHEDVIVQYSTMFIYEVYICLYVLPLNIKSKLFYIGNSYIGSSLLTLSVEPEEIK